MRACDAALEVLKETSNPSIMYGDEGLGHLIAKRLGWEHQGPQTPRRLLQALSKTPGRLVKSYSKMPGDSCARGQSVLCFELPEPEHSFLMKSLNRGLKPDWSQFQHQPT
jgi:hypothetical protein